jgi:hypothetical protein
MTMTFLGIPVEGDITLADKRTPQRPLEELAPLMQAVLDDDGIAAFGWRQYTPYFNDGDACIFGTSGVWVRTVDDTCEDGDTYGLEVSRTHPSLGNERWNGTAGRWETYVNERNDAARYDRCEALSSAIEGGASTTCSWRRSATTPRSPSGATGSRSPRTSTGDIPQRCGAPADQVGAFARLRGDADAQAALADRLSGPRHLRGVWHAVEAEFDEER